MDFRQLHYLITLERIRNFTQAATELHIAQTTLSQQIFSLESQLGFKLFERNNRSVKLTPAGNIFIDEAKLLVEQYENAVKKSQNLSTMINGNLSIGWWGTYDMILLSKVIDDYHNLYPNVTFSLYKNELNVLMGALQNELVNVLFIPFHYISNSNKEVYSHKKIAKSPLSILVSKDHHLANEETVSVKDMELEKIISIDFTHTPGAYEKMLWEYSSMGFAPNIYMQCQSFEEVYSLVALNWGITIAPLNIKKSLDPRLKFLKVEGKQVNTEVEAVWLERNNNIALRQFINLLQNSSEACLKKAYL